MQNHNIYFTLRNSSLDAGQKPAAIRSVYRAVDILVCLSNGIDTLSEITARTHLSKPTVYRLLKTLEELLMVTQDPKTHHYYLGPLVHQIASNPETNHQYLTSCAFEELRCLWENSGETVELNTMVGLRYARIYEIPSKYDLKVINGPDPVGAVYVGAPAKVLLSQFDDDELNAIVRNIKLTRVTESSVVDRVQLLRQVRKVRERGYEISLGERIPGAMCVSAPVKNYYWPVALALIGPEMRLKPNLQRTIEEVVASADRISAAVKEFLRAKGVIARAKIDVLSMEGK